MTHLIRLHKILGNDTKAFKPKFPKKEELISDDTEEENFDTFCLFRAKTINF